MLPGEIVLTYARSAIKEFIAKAKHLPVTLKTAESLEEALEYLKQGGIDVVLCDLSLPDEQGLETFRQLYSQFPQVPIIILTGLDDEEVAVKSLAEGAQDYLLKGDFTSDVLVRSIRYAIERQHLSLEQRRQAELLELRVKERTAELEQKNQQLQTLEVQLRQALAQEKELSHLKTRIITRISHEYRTPLTTILSSVELIEAYRHQWTEEKISKHFCRVQQSIQHMTDLINDVLFVSKAEFEKLEFQPVWVNLVSFFADLVEDLQLEATEVHHLSFTSTGDVINFYGDVKLLRQILTNLLSNAIKYSPQGGTISIKLTYDVTKIILQVQDEGIGIPKADKESLFESFSRASNVGEIQGTGLGLSIVRKSAERHGGEVTVESEVGVGTTFTVNLPVRGIAQ